MSTPAWPISVQTVANMYVAVNELQNNLNGNITNSVTTLTLNSTTGFPAYGTVLIDNEVILYTGISGANLTGLTRGFDGTTAASHTNGSVASFAIVADHHNILSAEINAIETYLSNNFGTGSQPLANGNRALQSNGSGKVVEATTTSTELGYVHGVTSAIQTQLNATISNPLIANLAAGGNKITGLAAGTTNGDALRYEQVIGLYLLLTGGTMSGAIAMGSNKITGLANGTATTDAMAFGQSHYTATPVSATTKTIFSTTSSTFSATSLTASITPSTSSSKIKVSCTGTMRNGTANSSAMQATIFRGTSVNCAGSGNYFNRIRVPDSFRIETNSHMTTIDSPATTSPVTYTVYILSEDNSTTMSWGDGEVQTIILEEVI